MIHGIFEPRDIFLDLLENRTREDGSDLGGWLAQLFQVLNTPEDRRSKTLDEDLARFPYVNLATCSATPLLIPSFDSAMRQRLIDACHFNWSDISPAIFGSLFQSVMDKDERRAQGAHYTTEQNILKVIEPLFLDELRAEFRRLQSRRDNRRIPELIAFQQRLGTLRFFDPACGCGNFLIIAYRELRALEIEVLKEIRPHGQLDVLAELLSVVDVDQFYGIELGEFPAHIAEVALWMMDHIMNNRLSLEFGQTLHAHSAGEVATHPARRCAGNGLERTATAGEMFLRARQSAVYRREIPIARAARTGCVASLRWAKAAARSTTSPLGLSRPANTCSRAQRESALWRPILSRRASRSRSFGRSYLIAASWTFAFAHRTFAWGSDARGMAHVHVVIIGLANAGRCAARENGCLLTTGLRAIHKKANMRLSRPICSTLED